MSKGGGGGGQGGGGAVGTSGGAVAAQQTIRDLLKNGISSVVTAKPTRSAAFQSAQFAGAKTVAQANKVATSQSYYKGATGNTPLKVTVYHGGKAGITDGNHRISAAKSAGATKIRVDVQYMGPRGAVKSVVKGKVVKL